MKILIPMSRTEDPYAKILVRADGSDINRDNVAMVINPFDEIAVEEALRLREAGNEVEIVMVCIGGSEVEKEVRRALAMGADRAIRIDCSEELSPERVTPLLTPVVEKESPDLIIMGKQSIDGDSGQVPQRLAQRLNWPQATFASDLKVQDGRRPSCVKSMVVWKRSPSIFLESSPQIFGSTKRLPKLPDIMKAKKSRLKSWELTILAAFRPSLSPLSTLLLHRSVRQVKWLKISMSWSLSCATKPKF